MRPHDDRGVFLKHALHKITSAGLPVQCFALLAVLVNASEGHDRQATYHAQRFLGEELGRSPSTIRHWTRQLVGLDLVEVTVHKAFPDPETGRFTRMLTKYRPKWSVRAAMARVIAAKAQVAPSATSRTSTSLSGGKTRRPGRWRGSKPPPLPPPIPIPRAALAHIDPRLALEDDEIDPRLALYASPGDYLRAIKAGLLPTETNATKGES